MTNEEIAQEIIREKYKQYPVECMSLDDCLSVFEKDGNEPKNNTVMTMKEQFEKQAADFADRHGFRVPYDGSNDFYDHVDVKASMDGFIAGAEFAYRTMLEKACAWLIEHKDEYAVYDSLDDIAVDGRIVDDLRKVMEEWIG